MSYHRVDALKFFFLALVPHAEGSARVGFSVCRLQTPHVLLGSTTLKSQNITEYRGINRMSDNAWTLDVTMYILFFSVVLPASGEREERTAAINARFRFGGDNYSDHMALLRAYNEFKLIMPLRQQSSFCNQNYLSVNALKMIDGIR